MKKLGLSILICVCVLIMYSVMNSNDHGQNADEVLETESTILQQEESDSIKEHSVAKFEMYDELFGKCFDEFWSIYTGEGIDELSVPEEDNDFQVDIQKLPDITNYIEEMDLCNLRDITGHNDEIYFLISNYERKTGNIINTTILAYNYENGGLKNILEKSEDNTYIIKLMISNDHLFWVETDYNYEENNPSWSIKCMNLLTEKIEKIDSSENYGRTTLMPIIQACNDRLLYYIGEQVGEEYFQWIKLYDANKKIRKDALKIENIIYAGTKPYIDENIIACAEYFDDGWYLLCYDIETENVSEIKLSFFTTEGEFPYVYYVADDQIIYTTSTSALYVLDRNNGELKLLEDCSPSVYNGVLLDREFLYLGDGGLWKYDLDSRMKTCYFKMEIEPGHIYTKGINATEETIYVRLQDMEQNNYYIKYEPYTKG